MNQSTIYCSECKCNIFLPAINPKHKGCPIQQVDLPHRWPLSFQKSIEKKKKDEEGQKIKLKETVQKLEKKYPFMKGNNQSDKMPPLED